MRIGCLASALLIGCLSCAGRAADPKPQAPAPSARTTSAGEDTSRVAASRVENGLTQVELLVAGGDRRTLVLPRDPTVDSQTAPSDITVLGEIRDVAIVLIDTYASRSGGLSYCQAGEEQFLRVVSLATPGAGEVATTKVASCRENLELADARIELDRPSRIVRIHWLSGPGKKPEVREIRIGTDGRVLKQL